MLQSVKWFQGVTNRVHRFGWSASGLSYIAVIFLLFGVTTCTTAKPVSQNMVLGTTNSPGANFENIAIERMAELLVGFMAVLASVRAESRKFVDIVHTRITK